MSTVSIKSMPFPLISWSRSSPLSPGLALSIRRLYCFGPRLHYRELDEGVVH